VTRVLVLRAREDAERTASRLRAMGFTPLLSPVLEMSGRARDSARPIRRRAGDQRQGLRILPGAGRIANLAAACGRRANRANRQGTRLAARSFRGEARALLPLIHARHETAARFLYLAGRDRQSDLETDLRARDMT